MYLCRRKKLTPSTPLLGSIEKKVVFGILDPAVARGKTKHVLCTALEKVMRQGEQVGRILL